MLGYLHTTWKSYVKAVFLYDLQDQGTNLADQEQNFGLYTYGGTAKPILSLFQALAGTTALS
jgi:hypothetical protein